MRALSSRVLVLVLLLGAGVASRAATMADLYSARVLVADQGAAALDTASREALAQVLVKIAGNTDVLRNPVVMAQLVEARRNVQQYAYSRDERQPEALFARFEFDDVYVTGLFAEAAVPFWTANRPPVLLWLVLQDGTGRQFVNRETAPELAEQVLAAFSARGVPVQLPLYDLVDGAMISPEEAWRLGSPSLQAASARYQVQHIAAGRLAVLTTGEVAGDWVYLSDEDSRERSAAAAAVEVFAGQGAALVAEAMSARYAVAPAASGPGGVGMSVVGVHSYADYAAIVGWLQSLELIERANLARVRGDQIELRLLAQGEADQLATIIELNQRLLPEPGAAAPGTLAYRWRN